MNDSSKPVHQVKVLFFANFRELTGTRELSLELVEGTRVDEVKRLLGMEYPNLSGPLKNVLVAINKEFAFDEDVVPEGAELAFFPPVSGGQVSCSHSLSNC